MPENTPITVAYGDGIGPEIMKATLKILEAGGAKLDIEVIEAGEKIYLEGNTTGIKPEAWDSLRRTKVFLKAPITTPQGSGYKSINVATRVALGLYANIRPCLSYHPFISTKHPNMNVVIVRENEEDLYTGIEYRQTNEVYQALKIISRPGSEKIIRYAFEYAVANGRKKVTCFIKDNIMKLTDGTFHKVFKEISTEYPDIDSDSFIVDIGAAHLANTPENFDVIVMENLYGDILSDVAAQITGSVGLCGSANIGDDYAMFEAIHGSAPDIAGKKIANPSGLLMGGVMMLNHIGQYDAATRIQNAWLRTMEDGIHTGDIYKDNITQKRVGTMEFADAVIERLGEKPRILKAVSYSPSSQHNISTELREIPKEKKELVGVDVYLDWDEGTPGELAEKLIPLIPENLKFLLMTNRGVKVWPGGFPDTFCTDHWRCRITSKTDGAVIEHKDIIKLLENVSNAGLDFIKIENLCRFSGTDAFSKAPGE